MRVGWRLLGIAAVVGIFSEGCAAQATPTYFIPPTVAAGVPVPLPELGGETPAPVLQDIPAPTFAPPSPTPPCTDGLTYVEDLTVPDGTSMTPGQLIDKRWRVSNSGTCNWDDRYQLRLIGGEAMGAAVSQPLYPARAGTEAVIQILFTAPQGSGTYETQWQAFNPDGVPFGSAFYMQIVVST